MSDVIVVCDTENIETGLPSITYSLRGIVAVQVEVQSATMPVHSGMAGGALADAALALNVILARLYWKNGQLPIPQLLRQGPPADRRGAAGPSARCPATRPSGARNSASCRACASPREKGVASLRADLAAAGRDGHRPGGQLDQGRVEPGAAEGVGDRQLPDRAGPGSRRGVRAAQGGPDERPAVGRAR